MKRYFPIKSKLIRVLVMIIIGLVLIFVLALMGLPRSLVSGITGFILYFLWPMLGGKWW